jgi:hypothetical protein
LSLRAERLSVSRLIPALKYPCLALLLAGLGTAAWWGAQSLVVARTLSESRTVADLAENVGKWASQYGGVHVRTQGADAPLPGSFLTRSVYARDPGEAAVLQGSRATTQQTATSEREMLRTLEAYHWKNPALVQRELADVLLASGSRAQYRLTARTVLNPSNAPTPFEVEALNALQQQAKDAPAVAGVPAAPREYWRVKQGELYYTRAVVAQKSCLKCHDTPEKAPDFLRSNPQFNGGGGFGYQLGQPAGLISVKMRLPQTTDVLRDALSAQAWAALGVSGLAAVGLLWSMAAPGAVRTKRPRN